MIRTILINLAFFAAISGHAQGVNETPEPTILPGVSESPGIIVPPGHGVCGPMAHVLYDCVQGPGYLRITTVNVYGQKVHKSVFIGSRDVCALNMQILKKYRHQLVAPRIVAVCSETQNTQLRWLVDQFGQMKALPQVQFPKLDECWADAHVLNMAP